MTSSRASLKLIGTVVVTAIMAVTVVVFSGIHESLFAPPARTVKADFERAPQLRVGDQVRMEGNVEGKVSGIEPGPRPEDARVTMRVDNAAGPIYADAGAYLRAKTLLGGAFYVDLDRGTKQAGPLGERLIARQRTRVQVEVEDFTEIFRDDAVTGLQTLPGELATALSNPGPPAQAIHTVDRVANDAATAVHALRGQRPGDDLPELIDATTSAVDALGSDSRALTKLVSSAAVTLSVTARRSGEIRQALDAAPGTATQLTHTLARLDTTLENARGLISRLHDPVPEIAPTLSYLRPTLVSTDRLLDRAEPLLNVAEATVDSLGKASRAAIPLIQEVRPGLKRLDEQILPYLNKPDPITEKPTTTAISGTAAFGFHPALRDLNGSFIRFPATIGPSSAFLPCSASTFDPSLTPQQGLACQELFGSLEVYRSYFGALPDFPSP